VFAETIFGRIVDHATELVFRKLSQAQDAQRAEQNAPLEASFNLADTDLEKVVATSADVDTFKMAIKNDEKIQQEIVAIARTSQGVGSLLAMTAVTRPLQLSPRTYLSPEVVSAIRGVYVQANRSL
jgi:hypothetical protein